MLAQADIDNDTVPVIPVSALDAVQSTPRRVGIETTFELFYMLAIANLMQDRRSIDSLSSFLKNHLPCFAPSLSNASQLQILQLSVKAINSGSLIGDRDVIRLSKCDLLQWRSLHKALSDDTHPDTKTNRHRLEVIRQCVPDQGQRASLSQLQQLKESLSGHAVEVLGPSGLDQLHSVQTVLHEPICFALKSVPVDRLHEALLSLATQSVWWPEELTPAGIFNKSIKTVNTRVLRIIVENADRCNLLENLLTLLAQGEDDPLIRDEIRLLQRLRKHLTDS